MFQAFAQRLYLRIWLAVVGGVAVLTLLVGLAWKVAQEHEARNSVQGTLAREITVTDATGAIVLQGGSNASAAGGRTMATACALPLPGTTGAATCWR